MKKFLLSLLIVGLTFISFSNAQFTSTQEIVNSIHVGGGDAFDVSSIFLNSDGVVYFSSSDCNGFALSNSSFISVVDCSSSCSVSSDYAIEKDIKYLTCNRYHSNGNDFYVKQYVTSSYLPVSALTPVVSGLFSVFGELIPYVIYISIGILIVTLGFYAIRWLVNWLYEKIKNNF